MTEWGCAVPFNGRASSHPHPIIFTAHAPTNCKYLGRLLRFLRGRVNLVGCMRVACGLRTTYNIIIHPTRFIHLKNDSGRNKGPEGMPSLAEMTVKAIKHKKGFVRVMAKDMDETHDSFHTISTHIHGYRIIFLISHPI